MDRLTELYEKNKYTNRVYMDNSATTMVDLEVINDMLPYFVLDYGNPSSSHTTGRTAKQAIQKAREQIASLLNCKPNEIYFTSGGTESNNLALYGSIYASNKSPKHIVTSKIEHKSILNACFDLDVNKRLSGVTYISVDKDGFINLDELKLYVNDDTTIVSVMYANNEVGTIQNFSEISKIVRGKSALLHTDATQAIGKVKIDLQELDVDMLTFSGHKIHAPKGIGILFVREGVKLNSILKGGNQEYGLRAGTENVANIVGIGKACETLKEKQDIFNAHIKQIYDYTITKLKEIPDIIFTGSLDNRVHSIISFCVKGLSGNAIVLALDTCGVECSSGSACNKDKITKSHVLEAMSISNEYISGSIRLSTSKYTKFGEIDYTIDKIKTVINTLKNI